MPWEEEGQQGQDSAAGDQGNGQGTGAEGQGQGEGGQQGQGQGQQQGQQQNDAARVAQAMREEMNQIKQQNQLLQQQVQFYQANVQGMSQQAQQGQAQQQDQEDPFANLDEDDVVDVPTMKRIVSQLQQRTAQQMREVQLRTQFPDIEQVIQQYLPNALNKNPGLQQALQRSGDPYLAYNIAKYEQKLQEGASGQGQQGSGQDQGQAMTQRILDNLGKPRSSGTTGGGGSGVDAAHAYLNMSDDDLERRIADVKARY